MVKINYKQAIQRPFTDYKKLLIGVALLLIPILNILTGFVVKGFQLECAKDIKKRKFKLPEWKNFKKHFMVGILSFLISFIYLIPALIILFASAKTFLLEMIQSTEFNIETFATSLTSAEITGLTIGVVLAILTFYVVPIALLEFLNKYSFKDAFKINTVLKKAFTGKYLRVILIILLYYVIVYIIFSLLMGLFALIPSEIVGKVILAIFSSLISYIIGITAFTLLGEVYPNLK